MSVPLIGLCVYVQLKVNPLILDACFLHSTHSVRALLCNAVLVKVTPQPATLLLSISLSPSPHSPAPGSPGQCPPMPMPLRATLAGSVVLWLSHGKPWQLCSSVTSVCPSVCLDHCPLVTGLEVRDTQRETKRERETESQRNWKWERKTEMKRRERGESKERQKRKGNGAKGGE